MRSANDLGRGWVPIERSLLSPAHDLHPRQQDEEVSRLLAWIDLWALAVWKQTDDLERGELRASQRELAQRWSWNQSRVHRFLKRLEEQGRIERDSGGGAQTDCIRIVRYEEVQPDRGSSEGRPGISSASESLHKPPKRITQITETPARSQGERITPANHTPNHTPIEEEQDQGAHTHDDKQDGAGASVQERGRDIWDKILTAHDENQLDDLNLPATEAKAFERMGGRGALEDPSQRHAEIWVRFYSALHELLSEEEAS